MSIKYIAADAAAEATKASPPLAVTSMAIGGHPVADWVMVLTGVYVALQAAFLIYKWSKYNGNGKQDTD